MSRKPRIKLVLGKWEETTRQGGWDTAGQESGLSKSEFLVSSCNVFKHE